MTDRVSPTVYLLARPHFDVDQFVRFLSGEGLTWRRTTAAREPEEIVEAAGRVCYLSFGPRQSNKTTSEYIDHLIKKGHESVLEHVSWTFLLTGVSRAFTHQLVRHRSGTAFSQLSQQYHTEEEASVVEPTLIAEEPDLSEIWHHAIRESKAAYQEILKRLEAIQPGELSASEQHRLARSAARSVLPEGTSTKLVFTGNARAIRYILALRGGIEGDEEMRQVCALIFNLVSVEAPAIFADFQVDLMPDGSPVVRQVTWTDEP